MRIGLDLGGTKTELLAIGAGGAELWRKRVATPRDFDGTVAAIAALVDEAETRLGQAGTVGLAIPGCETPAGVIKNANSVWLNGRPLRAALEKALGRDVRVANDANCFALSEARDGAGQGAGCFRRRWAPRTDRGRRNRCAVSRRRPTSSRGCGTARNQRSGAGGAASREWSASCA